MNNNMGIIMLGDIHGHFNKLMNDITSRDIYNYNIIQVGDFNIGFNEYDVDIEIITQLNNFFTKRNLQMYVVRGNHDNPSWFNGDYMDMFSNIHFVPDYTVLSLDGYKILCVGGAISIDRKHSLDKMANGHSTCYWEDEKFILNSDLAQSLTRIDIVVTHTAPLNCAPTSVGNDTVNNYAKNDDTLIAELISERQDLTALQTILSKNNNITHWFYGHYHWSDITSWYNTNYYLLGIDEMREVR